MNNLSEFFQIIQWACPGFFPSKQFFERKFTQPIEAGRKVGATRKEKNKMRQQACVLSAAFPGIVHRVGPSVVAPNLPPKHDILVSVRMTAELESLYRVLVTKVRTRLFNSVARDLSCGSIVLCLSAQPSAFEVDSLCSSLIERWESLQQTLDHPLPTRAIF
jgi:SNF2 family DNA or RNA helicase